MLIGNSFRAGANASKDKENALHSFGTVRHYFMLKYNRYFLFPIQFSIFYIPCVQSRQTHFAF